MTQPKTIKLEYADGSSQEITIDAPTPADDAAALACLDELEAMCPGIPLGALRQRYLDERAREDGIPP